MSVSVIGLDYDNEDGLAVSLNATFKAHRENGDAILNLEDARIARLAGRKDGPKKAAPRPAYKHQRFPMHVHHADGRVREVNSEEELATAKSDKFREAPYPVVRSAVGDPGAEKAALQAELSESKGKITAQNELLLSLSSRLEALEKAAPLVDPDPDAAAGDSGGKKKKT